MAKRYFEFVEGTSSKFWEIWMDGSEVYTRYGKIGADGATTVKDQGSTDDAQKLYDKLVREKTGKGYAEKGAAGAKPAAAAPTSAKPAAKVAAPAVADDDDDGDSGGASTGAAGARRFEFSEDGSNKFWEIRVEGSSHTVRYGKIGTDGQAKTKDFGSAALAQKEAAKLIAEKTKKGYEEV